ncbi:UNVERIFIED_CONTAM: hypothetical protein GTU68_047485, partial [Idotea baltica]|nr:hypothetical protein [Idotea baltica]
VADLLNVGTSALLSLQRAISTAGHNIANVNTEGYSRQRVNFDTNPAQFNGGNYIGTGVNTVSVERSYDQFLTTEVRSRTASQSGFQAFYELSSRLDGLMADPAAGLGPALDSFFGAVQDVANSPSSMPERQVLLGEAQVLADRFHYLDDNFRNMNEELNFRIEAAVDEINALATSIADINEQVVSATARSGGQSPNDLLDTRDQLINELSEKIGVTTVAQSDGSVNVVIGKGQSLVVGFTAEQLETAANPLDGTQTYVGTANPAGEISNLSKFLSGGELGAALDFRERVLDPAVNQLGLVAVGVASTVNDQHALGLDLNNQPGGEFFSPLNATFATHPSNTGTATPTIDIADVTELTGDDYSLRFASGQWTLTNLTTSVSQSSAGTFAIDGLDINISGTAAEGDFFLVQPTRQGASQFEFALNNAEDFAAAAPLRSSAALANGGGDNRNALALADLQIAEQLAGGTASYQETYGRLVADIAVQTRQAETGAATESVLLEQAVGARESVSGVNLDEEAADLIRFQQAYQAAAQMISVADQLFQTLLSATRR